MIRSSKKPTFPKRKDTLKRIVRHRSKPASLNRGNTRKKLVDLYSAQLELLREKDAQIRRLKSTGKLTKSREEKIQNQKIEIQNQISQINELLSALK